MLYYMTYISLKSFDFHEHYKGKLNPKIKHQTTRFDDEKL